MKCMQESPHSRGCSTSGCISVFYWESVLTDVPCPLPCLRKWHVWHCYLLSLSKESNNTPNFRHGTALTRVMYKFPFHLVANAWPDWSSLCVYVFKGWFAQAVEQKQDTDQNYLTRLSLFFFFFMAMMWRALEGSLGEGWVVILWRAAQRLCRCSCVGRALSWRWDVCLQEEVFHQHSFAAVLDNRNWSSKSILLLAHPAGLLLM